MKKIDELNHVLETLETLFVIFIIFKCTNVLDWTWGQVAIPAFMYMGLLALGLINVSIRTPKEPKELKETSWQGAIFMGLLQTTLLVLKVCGAISCPWIAVLMPLIWCATIFTLTLTMMLIVTIILSVKHS